MRNIHGLPLADPPSVQAATINRSKGHLHTNGDEPRNNRALRDNERNVMHAQSLQPFEAIAIGAQTGRSPASPLQQMLGVIVLRYSCEADWEKNRG